MPKTNEVVEKLDRLWKHALNGHRSPVLAMIKEALQESLTSDAPNARITRALCSRIEGSGKFHGDDFDGRLQRKLFILEAPGEWHICNKDLKAWARISLCGSRDYFPEEWHWVSNGIGSALSRKREWQAYLRFKEKGGATEEHRSLLRECRWEVDYLRGDWVSLFVDGKRPLGNSYREMDMHQALGWTTSWGEDEEMPEEIEEQLWDLFDELPYALADILAK